MKHGLNSGFLVPKFHLGTNHPRSSASQLYRSFKVLGQGFEAELPGDAFPSRAWEREDGFTSVW